MLCPYNELLRQNLKLLVKFLLENRFRKSRKRLKELSLLENTSTKKQKKVLEFMMPKLKELLLNLLKMNVLR